MEGDPSVGKWDFIVALYSLAEAGERPSSWNSAPTLERLWPETLAAHMAAATVARVRILGSRNFLRWWRRSKFGSEWWWRKKAIVDMH